MKLTKSMRDAFVRAAMADVPQIDYHAQVVKIVTDAAVQSLPPKVRAIWNDKNLRHFVANNRKAFVGMYVTFPGEDLRLSADKQLEIDELGKKRDAQSKEFSRLKQSLINATLAFTTHKALSDAMPEFAKYLPDDPAKADRSLPTVTNIVTDFVRAGWPVKSKK